ncbi:MAG TPA: hypothetical protein VF691_20265 [Cytophagaceae bacterium]|jgi:hypothetical protein
MDFEKISEELNNKNIQAIFDEKSESFKKFGKTFIGRLVGRTKYSQALGTKIMSFTILAGNYMAYKIPTEDIKEISEFCNNLFN